MKNSSKIVIIYTDIISINLNKYKSLSDLNSQLSLIIFKHLLARKRSGSNYGELKTKFNLNITGENLNINGVTVKSVVISSNKFTFCKTVRGLSRNIGKLHQNAGTNIMDLKNKGITSIDLKLVYSHS